MRIIILVLMLSGVCFSCNRAKQKAKETIHGAGETVAKGSSEFIKGVTDGIDESFSTQISISEVLKERGLGAGKCRLGDAGDSSDHILTAYLIFSHDFSKNISVKVYDKNDQEYGRASLFVQGKKGEAGFYDFIFDKRTDIESKSHFVFE